jgi:hypothetical protein
MVKIKDLQSIPFQKLDKNRYEGIDKCNRCYKLFTPENQLYLLPCKHAFHVTCLIKELNKNSCYSCNSKLTSNRVSWQSLRPDKVRFFRKSEASKHTPRSSSRGGFPNKMLVVALGIFAMGALYKFFSWKALPTA